MENQSRTRRRLQKRTSGATNDQLSASEVRRRAVTGAVVEVLRGSGVKLVGLLGTLVTARLLTPYDFGLVAIGTTVFTFGEFLDDGGVGTALIRRPETATKAELQSLLAFQFAFDVMLVVAVGLVMLPFGLLGQVTTVIVASLPLGAFRAPAYIIYERRLDYRPMAVVEIFETCVYYVWAIATIALGWGVWALATAYVIRAMAGLALLLKFLPEGRMAPVPSWSKIRPLLSFGVQYQAAALLHMLRDQIVNIGLATFGGVAVLGLWNIAWRIISIPVSLLAALWRVSIPGMSRLVAANDAVGSTIERAMPLVAIGTGMLVAPLAASAGAWIHVLIGAQWASAAWGVAPVCFSVAFGVPISASLAGYLWAIGSASVPMRATAYSIPVAALVLLPLIHVIGVAAAGLSYIGAAFVESVVLVRAARQTTTFTLGRRLGIPVLIATVSASCGWFVARWIGPDLAGALASSAVAAGLFLCGLATVHRAVLADGWALVARGLRGAVATPGEAPAAQPTPATG